MKTVVLDYGSGNITSVVKALEAVAPKEMTVKITNDPVGLLSADYAVLPGVGAFKDCQQSLANIPDMLPAIHDFAINKKRPFLGICVGMQLLATSGIEYGPHEGFGYIKGQVVPLPHKKGLSIPNIGWHPLKFCQPHALHDGLDDGQDNANPCWFYFVHSYYFKAKEQGNLASVFDYDGEITASIAHENLYGTQFHPEKSQHCGQKLLHNFLRWKP